MSKRLNPLLRPTSIAVLGATERPGSVGRQTLENLLQGRYPGVLYAVNPGYEAVLGLPCYRSLEELPSAVEHVIFAIGDARIEAALDDAIAHGVRAVTIMSSLVLANDSEPMLKDRVAKKVADSGLLVCGGNGMGFYNFSHQIWACGFDTRNNHRSGNIALISHSGSGMAGIVDVDERLDFSLAVSAGQELSVSMDEYLDYALDMPETKVVGLFMETVRNPSKMLVALEKANRKAIPVVVLKVGRTELSARLTVSHSGAIAGNDAAYRALFDRYGVQRVDDMDELATALIMFSQPYPVASGGLVAIHDSGGERQLMIDRAADLKVPITKISAATSASLKNILDPGLPAVNPLDAWGAGGANADQIMADSFAALMRDPAAAMGAVIHDRAPHGAIYEEYLEYLRAGHDATGKPVFLVANRQGTGADPLVGEITRLGFPVLDGLSSFLRGVKCLLDYRDFLSREISAIPDFPPRDNSKLRTRLNSAGVLDECESSEILAELGLPMNPIQIAESEAAVISASAEIGFPLVLKTAAPGLAHKTDHDGIRLNLNDEAALIKAYRDISFRLGPRVAVSRMVVSNGVEMMVGMIRDEQFGPLVVVGFGGANAEVLGDCVYALPPIDASTAERLIAGLKMRPLLDEYRGRKPAALSVFCETVARFSCIAEAFGDVITEVDMNPIIVDEQGCFAVDALVVGNAS